ncbi:UDP-2,4-diacetamido-2,4,6-trideoxy-beta-L-altropyranose hydrolase [Dyella sp. SG609]|uniref:UDP-2,4-diacetamido-2,4, 6-trideoxy-beta-L-altropyranose hydrolase n=1 Tax=Dyella sp. SG609 TaxID=2587018 RepID=UPI0014450490|nr:UDP-2,4-diacetamido-2,4,6-trideoxy-beta-L-altropyranose hydrolase [Dyella sp. SG609]NKJ22869.1 UDP-2,4-diacetamido-2,4,6-trideoxy-beta-L-altropyranose hydrolase/UDP-4-amino-4,6-dideoxy-N-acetyl-beta-L-altrosamine N-acetyltransferase [Dyella sp. SG609]
MKAAFRADASFQLGSGHVMRCLALARALREEGASCRFVCRELPGHLGARIAAEGFELALLPADGEAAAMDERGDAEATIEALRGSVDVLIVDHYALDARWEQALQPHAGKLVAIDDLADRPHLAQMLIDQNAGRRAERYAGLVSTDCRVLAGPRYAMLRPEFRQRREASLARRAQAPLHRIVISMGGGDPADATSLALEGLSRSLLPAACRITVVLGAQAASKERVRELAARSPWPCEVLEDVGDMAALLADCDLAIGAAGVSALERCCLGLPSLLVILADNQRPGAQALVRQGAAMLLGGPENLPDAIPAAMQDLLAPDAWRAMSAAAADICDGLGLQRVRICIEDLALRPSSSHEATVRPMRPDDLDAVLSWRNHPDVRRHMYTTHEIGIAEHRAWYERSAADPRRHLLIVEQAGQPLGFVHFTEAATDDVADWGFYAVPGAPPGTGRRLGAAALDHAFGTLGLRKVRGQALLSNERSQAMHRALGFTGEALPEPGHPVDSVGFGLTARQWRERAPVSR